MQKADINTIELGNLLFGNSRGNFLIERGPWEDVFYDFLHDNGFDGYGYKNDSTDLVFENETFSIRPYYWGDDETIAELPNFVYKPTGFTISWYKYPFRDAYASHDISDETFYEMLKDCERSLRKEA